jgi:predicted metal-binding protein
MMGHVVFICETCCLKNGQVPGAEFALGLETALAGDDVDVRKVACMNMCDAPMSLALGAAGKASYLFSGVEAGDVADAAALTRLYIAAEKGEITDARAAGRLRLCLAGKVPAL